jgi:hypothetical protein
VNRSKVEKETLLAESRNSWYLVREQQPLPDRGTKKINLNGTENSL